MAKLCKSTGRDSQVYWEEKAEAYREIARQRLYDEKEKLFVNPYDDYQKSVHSQVWMVLADVLTQMEAKCLMERVLEDDSFIKPVTPCMHHYVVEALMKIGMKQEAFDYIKKYWGQMATLGADTFWEVFVPGDMSVSPYGNPVMNSSCHAWSCSPAYFIRRFYNEFEL